MAHVVLSAKYHEYVAALWQILYALTANVHFALGGRVAGGLYGAPLDLTDLTGDGNPRHALDFRDVYATVLERWWNIDARNALGGRFTPVPFVRA